MPRYTTAPALPAVDFEGDTRDATPDIGADEFFVAPTPTPSPIPTPTVTPTPSPTPGGNGNGGNGGCDDGCSIAGGNTTTYIIPILLIFIIGRRTWKKIIN
ncbi:MAG TPA: hypothetical protein VHT73_10920 [Thermodesulfobacteriota bacterium]|nr:hypothetical protein [Thermodesulfobacteriota bacterium]